MIEVDLMLKAQELQLKEMMDRIDKNNKMCVKLQSESFNHEVKDMREISKERHIFFGEAVKKVREDVNFKIEEIRQEMKKEVVNVYQNYSTLHNKMYIVVDAVKKIAKFTSTLFIKVDLKSNNNSKEFVHL